MYDGVPTTAPAAVSPRDGRARTRFAATSDLLRGGRGRRRRARAQILGQPPVDDDGLAERADEDVARLEVAVDDPLVVRVGDRLGGGDHVRQQRQPVGERVGVADHARQRLPEDQLHHEERLAARPEAGVVDGHDARVLQARRELHLALEAGGERGVLHAQHLDRDRAAAGADRARRTRAPCRRAPISRSRT